MRHLTFALITFYSLFQIVLGAVDDEIQSSINGCSLDNLKYTKGLKGTLYQLDSYKSTLSSDTAFYQGQFSTERSIGTFLNTQNAQFSFVGGYTTFSGIAVDSSHIIMEEAGYFKADKTGIYRFDLTNIDDGVMVFIGGAAYDCCSGSLSGGNAEPFLFGVKKSNDDSNPILKSWVYLEANLVYPFKLVYFNGISAGSMSLQVTPPDGPAVDVAQYIYQIDSVNQNNCVPEVIQTSFVTSTSWIFSNNAQQITKKSSLVTKNGSTYVEENIVYGTVRSSKVTTNWTGSTTSYNTRTVFVTDGYQYVKEIVDIYRPPASTVTRYNRVQGTAIVTNTVNNIIYVNLPIPSTTVIVGKTPITTTVDVVVDDKTTKVVTVVVTDLPVTTLYPTNFVTSKTTRRIGNTWYEVVYEDLSTSFISGVSAGTTYPVTTTIKNDKTTITSTYVIVETIAISRSTTYYSGARRSTERTFIETSTSAGKTYGYYSYVYYIPFLKTSVTTGIVGTTKTISGAYTTYVQVITNAPTVITYDPTIVQKTQRYTTTVVGTSTGYIVEEIYPPPVVIPVEYTGSTTSTLTRWITNNVGSTVAWDEIRYIPAFSTSYSFWTDTFATTKYITSVFAYGPDLYSTTTIRFVERPPPAKSTDFWSGTEITTTYLTTTFAGNNNIPVTDILQVVLVPSPTIVVDGCSQQKYTVECTGSTSVFTVNNSLATVTGTTCEMPYYISGSFLTTTATSTITVDDVTSQITYVNVVEPQITCFTTTSVLNCESNTVYATCEYGTTVVSMEEEVAVPKRDYVEVTVRTTSCTVPSGIDGSFVGSTTGVEASYYYVTITNAVIPSFSCQPSTSTTTLTVCTSTIVAAPCVVSKEIVEIGTGKVVLSQVSCEMPEGVTGSFGASTSVTEYSDEATTTAFTITNLIDPVVECKESSAFGSSFVTSRSLPSKPTIVSSTKSSQSSLQTSSSSSLSSLSSLSSSSSLSTIPSQVSSSPSEVSSIPSQVSSSPSEVSSIPSQFSSSPSELSSIPPQLSSILPSVITRTTTNTVCEFVTSTVTAGSTVIEEVVLTPANSCLTKFATTTLTSANEDDCELKTITSTNTVVGADEITTIEVSIVELTPRAGCFETSTTTTVANSVCSLETTVLTSTVQENNVNMTIINATVKTPPATCNIFYTEYPATDCETTTATSFVGTTDWEGKYINATLIIVETPEESLCSLTSESTVLPTVNTHTRSTVYSTSYTLVTITSCSDNQCHITEVPPSTESTVVTESSSDIEPTELTSTLTSSHLPVIPEPTTTVTTSDVKPEPTTTVTSSNVKPEPTTTSTNTHGGPKEPDANHPENEPAKPTTQTISTSQTTTPEPDVPIFETNFDGAAAGNNVLFSRAMLAIILSALL